MEKLNLHDDDEEIEPTTTTKHNKPLTVVSEPNVSEIIKKHGALKEMDAVTSKDNDAVVSSSITSELKPVGVGTSTSNTDNIVGPKKITKAEMLRARFKRLKNIRENMDDDGNKVDTVAAPSLLSNTATDKPDIAEDDSDDITTTSSTLSASQKQPEADKRSVKEKEADTPKKGDIEAADPSSSGRFSPRTRRLLNALEHNTNPRRTLPNRTILPKPSANDIMQGLTFNRHDLYLKSYGLLRSPDEGGTPLQQDEDDTSAAEQIHPEHKELLESIDPTQQPTDNPASVTSPKVLETQHGVKYSALGGGARAPYYWGRYLKSPPVWNNSSRPEVSSPKAEDSWHHHTAAAQKHVSPRVPSGTLKPLTDTSTAAARKSFAAGRKSLLPTTQQQQRFVDVKNYSDEQKDDVLRMSPKLMGPPSVPPPSLPKHIYPHPPSSTAAQSWHQKQFSRRSSLTNSNQYHPSTSNKEDPSSLNRRPSESQLSEEDSFYLRSRQSRQTPIKSSHRLAQTMEPSPHVESMTKQEAREVVDFINKAVDASILRNLVRSPNKDVTSGNQRGTSGHGSNRYPVPPYHRNSDTNGRTLLRSGVSRHAIKQSSPVPNNANGPRTTLPVLPPVKSKKKRCYLCGKRTGLATSYMCRCGNNFCAQHRYAETHDCSFDYKAAGRKLLEEANPLVSAPKLPKI